MSTSYVDDIRRYLLIIEKSFDEATQCRTCQESCCDMFHNIKSKIFYSLDKLEQEQEGGYNMTDRRRYDEYLCCDECYEGGYEDIEKNIGKSIYITSFLEQDIESLSPIAYENETVQNDYEYIFEKTSDITILIKERGYYSFYFYCIPKNNRETIALFLDDIELPFTRFTSKGDLNLIVGSGIFEVEKDYGEVKVINVTDNNLKIQSGALENTVTASLRIEKI